MQDMVLAPLGCLSVPSSDAGDPDWLPNATHQLLVFFRYWLFRPQRSGRIKVDGPPQGKECGEQCDEAQENSGCGEDRDAARRDSEEETADAARGNECGDAFAQVSSTQGWLALLGGDTAAAISDYTYALGLWTAAH